MPRKGHVKRRVTAPDSMHQSQAIAKFISEFTKIYGNLAGHPATRQPRIDRPE